MVLWKTATFTVLIVLFLITPYATFWCALNGLQLQILSSPLSCLLSLFIRFQNSLGLFCLIISNVACNLFCASIFLLLIRLLYFLFLEKYSTRFCIFKHCKNTFLASLTSCFAALHSSSNHLFLGKYLVLGCLRLATLNKSHQHTLKIFSQNMRWVNI